MIAATIAGSWRVSCGFAEEDGQARGDLGAQKSRSRVLCFLSRRAQAADSFSPAMFSQRCALKGIPCFAEAVHKKVR